MTTVSLFFFVIGRVLTRLDKKTAGFLGFYPLPAAGRSVKQEVGWGKTQLPPGFSWLLPVQLRRSDPCIMQKGQSAHVLFLVPL